MNLTLELTTEQIIDLVQQMPQKKNSWLFVHLQRKHQQNARSG